MHAIGPLGLLLFHEGRDCCISRCFSTVYYKKETFLVTQRAYDAFIILVKGAGCFILCFKVIFGLYEFYFYDFFDLVLSYILFFLKVQRHTEK